MRMSEVKVERNYSPNLLNWNEFEHLINIRPLMTKKRVKFFNSEQYRWTATNWVHDPNTYPSSIMSDMLSNTICYFSDMSRCTEKINQFATEVENEYRISTDAHIYVCRVKQEHPFGVHVDHNDNIIVQCEGETNFKVWNQIDDRHDMSVWNNLSIEEEPIVNVDMKPGDAIWIPMYYPHLATSQTKRLSVSFPMGRTSIEDVREEREWITL